MSARFSSSVLLNKNNSRPHARSTRGRGLHVLALSLVISALVTSCGQSLEGNLVPATVMEDDSLPAATINGARLHLRRYNTDATNLLVILHGGPGFDHRALLPLAESLSDSYQVVIYDQRGAGLSERFDPDHGKLSVDGHVADLEAIRARYAAASDDAMAVIGHSWGGGLLQAYIEEYPTKVSQAVFLASMAVNGSRMNDNAGLAPSLLGSAFTNYLWQRNFTGESHAELDLRVINIGVTQDYYWCGSIEEDLPRLPFWRFGYVSLFKTMENGLLSGPPVGGALDYDYSFKNSNADFPGEVLILNGECDQALGEESGAELAETFENAARVEERTISDGGHYFWLTNEDSSLSAIRAFLGL